ncbi:MAG: hypothetical protein AAF986_09755 [Pseudomonadota bacterium]
MGLRRAQVAVAASVAFFGVTSVYAQERVNSSGQPIIIPSQSSVYNQNSVALPTPPNVSGQDIIRGADGTSCQSAVASGGPYVDMGVIGSQDFFSRDSSALYGRVVVPLGKRAKRVDCTRLYELEISRMKMEIELLRMGTMMSMGGGDRLLHEANHTDQPPLQGNDVPEEEEDVEPQGFILGGSAMPPPVAPPITPPVTPHTPPSSMEAAPSGNEGDADGKAQPVRNVETIAPTSLRETGAPKEDFEGQYEGVAERQFVPQRIFGEAAPMAAALSEGMAFRADGPPARPQAQPATWAPVQTHFVQLGAFSTWQRAQQHLSHKGEQHGVIRSLERNGQVLYRALLGPMSHDEAIRICGSRHRGCFVADG